jgi:hypothetical protein
VRRGWAAVVTARPLAGGGCYFVADRDFEDAGAGTGYALGAR